MRPIEITYIYDDRGNIILQNKAPFDGKPVLIRTSYGWCEAWWMMAGEKHTACDGVEYDGFCWVCCDDKFMLEVDDPTHWMPLPQEAMP